MFLLFMQAFTVLISTVWSMFSVQGSRSLYLPYAVSGGIATLALLWLAASFWFSAKGFASSVVSVSDEPAPRISFKGLRTLIYRGLGIFFIVTAISSFASDVVAIMINQDLRRQANWWSLSDPGLKMVFGAMLCWVSIGRSLNNPFTGKPINLWNLDDDYQDDEPQNGGTANG